VKLFNSFTGHSLHEQYRKLLVVPENTRGRFYDPVERESSTPGRVGTPGSWRR